MPVATLSPTLRAKPRAWQYSIKTHLEIEKIMSKVKTIVLAAALAMGAQAAYSADNVSLSHVRLTKTVSYGDLDLERTEGVAVLYKRLNHAAKAVCGPLKSRQLRQMVLRSECIKEALANAITDVDQPLLTQYYRSNGSASAQAVVANR